VSGGDSQKAKKARAGGAAPATDGASSDTEAKPGVTGEAAADGEDKPAEGEDKPAGSEDKRTEGDASVAAQAEVSEEQKLQDALRVAHERGVPAVVVFGSREAKDTEKLLGTLDQNMKEGKADYIFVDTDRLDPNSELGQVARRSEERGLGLGEDGKSDLAFTGVYKVEKGADGQYHLGNSVATFWGGRPEISAIMNDQLKYATNSVPGGGSQSDRLPPAPGADANRPGADTIPPKPDAPPQTDAEKAQAEANAKAEAEARVQAAKDKAEREAAEAERVKQFSDKPYSMAQYQEGWGRFLDRAGMEAGPMRDLAESFGQQMLSGNIDGKQLSGLMSQLDNLERGSAAQMLSQVNQELKDNGVSIAATVKDGKIEAMEMRAENGNVVVRVDQNGNVVATNKLVSTGESPEQISLRLAKKIEPDACP
jgi:hypothetical protein